MTCVRLAIAAVLLSSCVRPASQPVKAVPPPLEVDFSEIAPDRCSPPLDGLFVSHSGAIDLVRGMRKIERDYQIKAIDQDTAVRACQTKLEASEQELAEAAGERTWALVGKLSTTGLGVAVIVTAVVLIANAFGVKK